MSKKATETPLMRQYNEIKAKHPEALLLFRVGDFYETFGSDAVKASKILGIVLTKRKNGAASSVELAGFPHHALDTYLPKLVKSGERVAICDQLEDPKQTKTIVKRGITELVTPGTALNENLLEHRENNFLASVYKANNVWGIALLDVSTGEFFVAQGNAFYIDKLIQSFQPSELLMMRNQQKEASESFDLNLHQFPLEDWCYEINSAEQKIQEHFGTKSLKGFGIDDLKVSIQCAGSIMQYLNQTRHEKISHIHSISRIEHEQYVWLDRFTVRNLEILNSSDPEGKSLLDVMDHSITPMGARMIRRWVGLPLKNHSEIKQRQSFVEMLISKDELRNGLIEVLNHISDLERLLGRLSTGRTSPKEIRVLHSSLENVQQVKSILKKSRLKKFLALADQISDFNKILDRIDEVLSDSPPAMVAKGGVIKEGFSEELDELRGLQTSGTEYLNKLQKKEIELQNKIKIQSIKKDITKNIRNINNVNFFVGEIDLDPKSIKELCFTISDQIDNLFMILLSKSTDKVFISCFLSKNIILEKELDASNVIKELSPLINGSGGGQSFYATGGGTNVDGIDSVISEAEKIISQI